MTKHPSEFFIKYLLTLTRKEAQDDVWIQDSVKRLGFPEPKPEYVALLRDELYADLPAHYVPDDRFNRPSVKYLRANQIYSLHNPDKTVRDATALLVDFKARKLIEQMLLGRMKPKDIALKANSRLSTFLTSAIIKTYGHYYWNVSLLKSDEWVDFFDEYEKNDLSNSMAILRGGPAMALHLTGFKQHLESKEILRSMQEGMYFDFLEWQKKPHGSERTKAMTSLAKGVSHVDVRLSESDSALRESLKAFENFQMKHSTTKVPGIDDIAPGGTFTDSGAEMKELAPPQDEEDPNVN